jgi:hypothetical protein
MKRTELFVFLLICRQAFGVDSGAEKDVIRQASSYLDFLIVQYFGISTDLFTLSEESKAIIFNSSILKANTYEVRGFLHRFGSLADPFVFAAFLVDHFCVVNVLANAFHALCLA